MSVPMPNVIGMTEAEAQAAMVTAGMDADIPMTIIGAVGDGWNDEDYLGTAPPGFLYADTVTADGTISMQSPAPGFDMTLYIGGGAGNIAIDVWGVDDRETPFINTTVGLWASDDENTLYEFVASPLPTDDSGSSFRVEITSLHTPTGDAELLFEFTEFKDLSVKIPINDARTAELIVSVWDPVLDVLNGGHDLLDFEQYLRIYYRDQPQPVFWGPLRTEDDYAPGEIKITAVDALRVQHHFVRLGDPALNDGDLGTLMADGSGIQYLLLAAQNTTVQDARGVPVLGMDVVDESSPREIPFEIQRGDNVWDKIVMIAGTATGPDFELSPVDDETGLYAHLTVYDVQGTDRGRDADPVDGILFTFGAPPEVGADNLSNVRARKLNPITHAHVLDDRREHRVTSADEDSSADIGVYVEWVQSNVNLVDDDTTILEEIAAAYVDAYGRPPHAIDVDLRPDAVQVWFYNEDFFVGDIVSIYATKGYRGVINTHMRIISVELTQPGKRGPAVTRLSIVPYVARTITDEGA